MMKMKVKSGDFLRMINILSNIDKKVKMWIRKDSIQFDALDPLKKATVRIFVYDDDIDGYKSDMDQIFEMDISDIKEDMNNTPSGPIYIAVGDSNTLILKSSYYTSKYSIQPLEEGSLPETKENIDDIGIPLPSEISKFLKLLKARTINNIKLQQKEKKLLMTGEINGRIYSHETNISLPKKKFGRTMISTLWFSDTLNTLDGENPITFCFSGMGNLYMKSWNPFKTIVILAGTSKKIGMPEDIPKIDTKQIDEIADEYQW